MGISDILCPNKGKRNNHKMLVVFFLIIMAAVFISASDHSSATRRHYPPRPTYTPPVSTPEEEEEEEEEPTPPSVSAKEAIAMARAAENEEPWIDKMRRKYPVFPLGDGRYEVRAKGKDGHTYTCRSSEKPDAQEYGLILMELQYKENIKDYAQV